VPLSSRQIPSAERRWKTTKEFKDDVRFLSQEYRDEGDEIMMPDGYVVVVVVVVVLLLLFHCCYQITRTIAFSTPSYHSARSSSLISIDSARTYSASPLFWSFVFYAREGASTTCNHKKRPGLSTGH
jgi:hypothetical protein